MRLTQKVIDEIQLAMTHTKMNGDVNWKELEETEETGIGNISNDNAGTSKHALFDA